MVENIQLKWLLIIILLAVLGIGIQYLTRKNNLDAKKEMFRLIEKEYKAHPQMNEEDLYKFIHQAAMGSEHAVKDTIMVRNWMKNEISTLDMSIENNLIDTLSPDGKIVRVNLRPYLKQGYNPDKLVKAFIQTANNNKGNIDKLKEYSAIAKQMIRNNMIGLDPDKFKKLINEMKLKNYSAIHHSSKYEELYKPAYRVIASEYLPDLLKK